MYDKMKTSQNTKNGKRGEKKTSRVFKRKFQEYMMNKLAVAGLLISLALIALIGVIYHIIDTNGDSYYKIVLSQRQRKYANRVIPYKRGDIVDRNGTFIAMSEKVYNLVIDPSQILAYDDDTAKNERYLQPTADLLSEYFGVDANEFRNMILEKGSKSYYLRYKGGRRLSYDQKNELEALIQSKNEAYKASEDENEKVKRVVGLWFEDEYRRIYPYDSMGSFMIGFSSGDGSSGTGGIEQYYNDELVGVNGREYGYLDDSNNLEGVVKPAINGNTVVSTLDINIQNIAQKYVDEWQNTIGSKRTAAIVMNPNNGEILAMASSDAYDLNNPRDLGDRYTENELYALGLTEAAADYKRKNGTAITEDQVPDYYKREDIVSLGTQVAWNQRWRNFIISDTYEPGSPAKIFTVAAGLEEGVLTGNETYVCNGHLHVGGRDIYCVSRIVGHGTLTVQQALMKSCNVALMQMASSMGVDRFAKYQEIFGFGEKTGIDLPGEADTTNLIYHADNMGPVELATSSFGQGYTVTMVQMAAALSSVVNGGTYYQPHVVRQILNENGSVVEKKDPVVVRETVSQSTASFLKEAMFQVVANGTGSAAAVAGYEVGGKTGTAEKLPRKSGRYLVSFAGFAPVSDPQVVVYVIIDEPGFPPGPEQAHSSYASGVFSKIMGEILPYINVFPTEDTGDETTNPVEGLPENEGINDGEAAQTPAPQETITSETDEYIDSDIGSGLPDTALTGSDEESTQDSSEENLPETSETKTQEETTQEETTQSAQQ